MKWIVAFLLGVGSLLGGAHAQVNTLDSGSARADDGYEYFPTQMEQDYLYGETGGRYYPRSLGGATSGISHGTHLGSGRLGPDTGSLTSAGLWEATETSPNYYQRHDRFFGPTERFLGVFAKQEGIDDTLYFGRSKSGGEADDTEGDFETLGGVSVDFGLPFTRQFDPDRAHLKLGPAYFDLLSISATALYTDVRGPRAATLPDDGWIGIVGLTSRALIRFTDNLYLSAIGTVYWLPDSNQVGFYIPVGNNVNSGVNVHVAWDKQFGEFEFQAFDEFRTYYRIYDLYDEAEADEIDRAGRYRFGRIDAGDDRATDYFSNDSLFLVNDVGVRMAWDDESPWFLQGTAFRRDIWAGGDRHLDPLYYGVARATYDRQDWRLAPFVEYRIRAQDDDIDTLRQDIWLGVRGPITQNIYLVSQAGYTWSSGAANDIERFLWEIGLRHILGPLTTHSLFFGQTVDDGQLADQYYADYVRYTIHHQFCANLRGSAYGQLADIDNSDFARGREGTLWLSGAQLSYALGDFSNITLETFYEDVDYDFLRADHDRWVHRARYSQRVLSRLWASVLFQYENFNSAAVPLEFDEYLFSVTLTRYF